jgi:ribosomal protein L11 methyltransferase
VPYRVDIRAAGSDEFDRLVELGAIDAELAPDGVAALMPDRVRPEQVSAALGVDAVAVSTALGRDADSVWILTPRPVRIGRLVIAPASSEPGPGVVRLLDSTAFGTGLHPTTALCLQALEEAFAGAPPDAVLDVGTGSGVLALAALELGAPRALGVDVDEDAIRAATANARINAMTERLTVASGGPESVTGVWSLVLANVLAAPLIEMAPTLVRRVGHRGRLILSGIPAGLERDVDNAYRRLGMVGLGTKSLDGWVAVIMQASW